MIQMHWMSHLPVLQAAASPGRVKSVLLATTAGIHVEYVILALNKAKGNGDEVAFIKHLRRKSFQVPVRYGG